MNNLKINKYRELITTKMKIMEWLADFEQLLNEEDPEETFVSI